MNMEKCLRLIKSKGFFYITLEYTGTDTKHYEIYADLNPKSLSILGFKKLGVIILDDNLEDVLLKTIIDDPDKDVKDVIEVLQCKYLFSDCYSYFKCCIGDENG